MKPRYTNISLGNSKDSIVSDVFHMDCVAGMKHFPDKYFDLAIVDPPYGININRSGRLGHYGGKGKKWDTEIPNDEYLSQLFRVSKNQIIWGGNYFTLPPTRCFLIWDKQQPENVSFASCEFAWTSFNQSAKTFYARPQKSGCERIHPTQKPIDLYKWILTRFAYPGMKILDTHLGSGSSRIAAYHYGCDFYGFELDEEYLIASDKRFRTAIAQQTLEII